MNLPNNVCAALATVLFVTFLHADIIDPDYHPVERCVTLGNLSDYPDIVIIGTIKGASSIDITRYVVKEDSCLTKGYKMNSFFLFWAEKTYFEQQGLDSIPIEDLLPMIAAKKKTGARVIAPYGMFSLPVEPNGGTVPNTNPVVKELLVYNLTGADVNYGLSLYLAKKTTIDKDGVENIESFYPPTVSILRKQKDVNVPQHTAKASFIQQCLLFTTAVSENIDAELIDCRGSVISRFSRTAEKGKTYTIPCVGIAAGMYWLHVTTRHTATTLRINRYE